jgi:hypothetical protein
VLVAAAPELRGSPAVADASVLATLVSIQHLLCDAAAAKAGGPGRLGAAGCMSAQSAPSAGGASSHHSGAGLLIKGSSVYGSRGSSSMRRTDAAVDVVLADGADAGEGRDDWSLPQRSKLLHVVACVSTMSSKSVAAAFFGPSSAGATFGAGHHGSEWAKGGAAAAAAAGGRSRGSGGSSSSSSGSGALRGKGALAGDGLAADAAGIMGRQLFTYELLVPGEIESCLLVQAAKEPEYVKVSCGWCVGLQV